MAHHDCFLCQKPNCITKCPRPNCGVYYCCDSHYSSHVVNINQNTRYHGNNGNRRSEKSNRDDLEDTVITDSLCLPFKVVNSDRFGRHFVATRDIKPLELILVDPPGVVGPSTKTKPVCIVCLCPSIGKYR